MIPRYDNMIHWHGTLLTHDPIITQVAKNDGRITFAHFKRILDYIGVIVTPEDFNLLVRRYIKDSYTLDYVEFLKGVEAVKKEGIQGLGAVRRPLIS